MIELYVTPSDDMNAILQHYPLNQDITLNLEPGIYHQKLILNHENLTIVGASASSTIIVYNDYSYKMHEDGLLYNTFRTSTVAVIGQHITFKHLTIKNSSGYGLTIGQAVALSVYGDHFKAIDCQFIGHQDTLFIGPLPIDLTERYHDFLPTSFLQTKRIHAFFYSCRIEGDVDFIFGSGIALFQQCEIVAVNEGYIFAPSTYKSFPYGMIAYQSHFQVLKTSYLARPWRSYGQVHIIKCSFAGDIHPDRYTSWNKHHVVFKEYPYQPSSLSSPTHEDEIEHLTIFINQTFGIKN